MKVKMKEVFQSEQETGTLVDEGIKVKILEIGETYIVDDSFGTWLLEHGKAEEIKSQFTQKEVKDLPESNQEDEVKPVFTQKKNKK